jgi:hypothetical protein
MRHLIWLLVFVSAQAGARTKIDVSPFTNRTAAGPCNIVQPWQKDIEDNFKFQLANALTESGQFNIVEAEQLRSEERAKLFDSGVSTVHKKATFKASEYSIVGALKKFDACGKNSEVVLEVRVIDNKFGGIKHRFITKAKANGDAAGRDVKGSSFSSGVFKDSAIGRATVEAIAKAATKLKKAFPNREIASGEYKIQTIPRARAR